MTKSIKNDNRGLTLIELIIGVVILAIVITPLLHTLITGANTTMKSKRYNDATIAAQNLAEKIEASDMADYLSGAVEYSDGSKTASLLKYTDGLTGKILKYVSQGTTESGGTSFDYLVTLVPTDGTIPVARQMTTQFAMQKSDQSVFDQFIIEGGSADSIGSITRSMTLDVVDDGADSCRVTLTFEYSALIPGNEEKETADKTFSRTLTQSKAVSVSEGSVFPVYLFFSDAPVYEYTLEGSDVIHTSSPAKVKNIITVNNYSKSNFSLFLIDTAEAGNPHELYYYPRVKTNNTEMKLQTNLVNLKYKVFRPGDTNWMRSKAITPGLMETDDIARSFDISIAIYKLGERALEGSEPLFTIHTDKLDYSTQYSNS